jgi:hypothetical protein
MRKYTIMVFAVALSFAIGMMAQTSSGSSSSSGSQYPSSSDESGMQSGTQSDQTQSGSSQSDQTANPGTEQGNPTNRQPGMGTAPQTPTGGYGGEPATGAQSSQTGTSSANTSSSSGHSKTIQGCVVRQATEFYIYPAKGQPEHISSSGQDVSAHVGHQVKAHGTEQPSTAASASDTSGGASGAAGSTSASNTAGSSTGSAGSMSGNTSGTGSSAATSGQDLIVDRVDMIATNCPASIASKAQAAGMSTSPQ